MIMQNKPNLPNAQMTISFSLTKYYENKRLFSRRENKPKQTQFNALKEMVKNRLVLFDN